MSEFQFDTEGGVRPTYRPTTSGAVVRLFKRLTGIEDDEKANKVLLVVAIVFLLASVIILWRYL